MGMSCDLQVMLRLSEACNVLQHPGGTIPYTLSHVWPWAMSVARGDDSVTILNTFRYKVKDPN